MPYQYNLNQSSESTSTPSTQKTIANSTPPQAFSKIEDTIFQEGVLHFGRQLICNRIYRKLDYSQQPMVGFLF